MENITQGHWIFAGIFFVTFVTAMVWAYRNDIKRIGKHYKRVWLILISAGVIYAIVFMFNRLT